MTEPGGRAAASLRYAPHVAVCSVGYVAFTYAAVPGFITAAYGVSLAAVGLLMSAALGSFVIAQVAAGRLLARTTTTRTLLGLLGLHALLAVATDLAPTFAALLTLRVAWGLAGGLILSVGATHVARLHEGAVATRQQGIYGGSLTLGGAAGFLVAETLVRVTGGFGIHAVGALLAIPAIAMLWPHRTGRGRTGSGDGPDTPATAVLRNRAVLVAALCYVAIIGSYVTLSTFVTAYFTGLGVTGPLNAAVMLVATGSRVAGGVLADRFSIADDRLVQVTGVLAVGAFAALAISDARLVALAVPLIAMLAVSLPFGAVYSLAAAASPHEGAALAVVVAAGNVAAAVLPSLVGVVRTVTGEYHVAFVLLAALNAAAVLGVVRVNTPDEGADSTVEG